LPNTSLFCFTECDGRKHVLQTLPPDFQSSPKKKKKKKKEREKKDKLIVMEVGDEPEMRIGKIVIVNGTKIQTQPISPIPTVVRNVTVTTPPPLRSASPKITIKTEIKTPVVTLLPKVEEKPPEEPPAEPIVEPTQPRKRKLSADNICKKVPKSGKRRRTASLKDTNAVNATLVNAAATTTSASVSPPPPAKPVPAPKPREEKPSLKPPPTTPTPSTQNGRRRDSSNGSVVLSDNLKRHLTSDFEMVTKKRRLNTLPAEPNIVNVLEDFVRHYSSGRLVAFEKHQRKSLYTAHRCQCYKSFFFFVNDGVAQLASFSSKSYNFRQGRSLLKWFTV